MMADALVGLSGARLVAAGLVAISYLALCVHFLRPSRARAARSSEGGAAPTLVAFASQTGFAAELAERTAQSLRAAGAPVLLASLQEVSAATLQSIQSALFVVSTTGEGDAPDSAAGFIDNVLESSASAALGNLEYGVLALGDRDYRNYCAFGRQLDQGLRHRGARALFDVVEVDNGDEGALRHWQHQLGTLCGNPDLPDWEAPRYERWRLTARRLLNPGSAGGACFHIELQPPAGSAPATWQAGDIAEVDPRNSTWQADAPPLPHREYSIASLPADGAIHLLVRQMQRAEGESGLGSGWLTTGASIGEDVALRVRRNPNFHPPADGVPLLLIGNGTGIAGLRALLKARIAAGQVRNWLIFGERNRAHDAFYAEELEGWRASGQIERLDWVFSRDQPERRYVQDCIRACGMDLRRWIESGAAVYVCGSLQGMAPAVEAALSEALGGEHFEELSARGRYRRDVY